jgi:hypothetical protein
MWNACERFGVHVDSWQFNEVSPIAGKEGDPEKARERRQLCRWVIEGVFEGRKDEGDQPLQGIVFVAPHDLADGALLDAEVRGFWETIDRTCFRVLSEEYPNFVGDPRTHDREFEDTVKRAGHLQLRMTELASRGEPFRSLSKKIVPLGTPGFHRWKTWEDAQHHIHFVHTYKKAPGHRGDFDYDPATHEYVAASPRGTGEYEIEHERVPTYLGGELDTDHARASEWRRAFMLERLEMGATGLGEWGFVSTNAADPSLVETVFEDIAWALRQKK